MGSTNFTLPELQRIDANESYIGYLADMYFATTNDTIHRKFRATTVTLDKTGSTKKWIVNTESSIRTYSAPGTSEGTGTSSRIESDDQPLIGGRRKKGFKKPSKKASSKKPSKKASSKRPSKKSSKQLGGAKKKRSKKSSRIINTKK
jgi:hypothetical protein